ncbi:hypothetical protein MRB53_039942 [Persea americana]|nr:hypothetical protein MRB53_039942 [Persea americana]
MHAPNGIPTNVAAKQRPCLDETCWARTLHSQVGFFRRRARLDRQACSTAQHGLLRWTCARDATSIIEVCDDPESATMTWHAVKSTTPPASESQTILTASSHHCQSGRGRARRRHGAPDGWPSCPPARRRRRRALSIGPGTSRSSTPVR